ncbi:competence/damage-inducible protein A [Pelagicoccus sp. SDUM812003]|uniref:competence/damage-inducible protein A n=1 Tax=Pelagicoccus sp. SDUM812003 TaxID=3041267 RepID=UPI00280F4D7B|nr:competence/damage-inducible protein A [Pelagicoccus sp. SDUM812003]MDQ8204224.1 competence/damage-inducible protein A [Pelagicoccus sp. SDUM812003]
MVSASKIILLTLGEELLLGLTANTHLTYIGEQLRLAGATMHANLTLSDDPADIEEHFKHYWEKSDVLITSGGLGPTVDDRTREVIAECLGEPLVFDPTLMQAIEDRFAALGIELTENNRKQAYRFQNAEALENPNGTAPGIWLEKDGKILVMLPGPPGELRPMFENQVMPRLREKDILGGEQNHIQLRTSGVGESSLETLLQPVFDKREGLQVAYCAHLGMVDFRIGYSDTVDRYDELVEIAYECRELLGENFISCGNDSLEKTVANLLKRKKLTLAIAESCTGGMVSDELTNLSGATDFFKGSLIAYTSSSKEELLGVPAEMMQQHGEVSMEVAIAMAVGISEKLESDFALSTTGYLGPNGGNENCPVGTIYLGLHSPRGTWAKKLFFKGTRASIKRRAHAAALDWLRRELLANEKLDDDAHSALKAESDKILRSLK